ncbi:MAG: MauE/DoxX family redox-associated membrane protein [Promethearchaeota archaeon]
MNKNFIIIIRFITENFVVGSLFIYSGLYKLKNPYDFIITIENLHLFHSNINTLVIKLLPWIEIFVGVSILTHFFSRYGSFIASLLLFIFISISILNISKGHQGLCGCFPPSFILSSKNPFFIITRDFILLLLTIKIMVSNTKLAIFNKLLTSWKHHKYEYINIILIIYSLLILSILIFIKNNENNFIMKTEIERESILKKTEKIIGNTIPNAKLKTEKGEIIFLSQLLGRYCVILILDNFECKPCIDEASYFEMLFSKYSDIINFIAVTRIISPTAILNFKKRHSITYPFFQDLDKKLIDITNVSKTLKIVISPRGEIIKIDPPTYNLKHYQREFGTILNKIKGGD